MKTKEVCITLIMCLCLAACSSGPQKKKTSGAEPGVTTTSDNGTMQRLIRDYAGMQEDDIVSWAWIDSGFRLKDCGAVSLQPVFNYSMIEYPLAQQHIETALKNALDSQEKPASGGKAVFAAAAITGMQGKPGFIKRFSPSYEDTPSIELELIIVDAASKRELVKICHMARAEKLDLAVEKLLKDITAFLGKKI
ncbi:MAG: hypothetical protein JW832_15510 [Deltaproteobacteria bacterium]|nr:hypothetical protein [Deltaproteobacteria bacterium]